VRESISAQLDGELPEPELDRLEMHISVCPDCSAWAEEVQDLTRRLRETRLEEPAERFVLPGRGRRRATAPAALVAAAAACLVAVLGSSHSLLGSSRPAHVVRQGSAPALIGLENARLGLESLPARSHHAGARIRFRAV
jgi:anti-sigma factor RsiW